MNTTDSTLWPYLTPASAHGDDSLCGVSARGHRIRYADGRELLDGSSGLWNVNLGYGNDAIADAVADAMREASYLSAFRYENVYARRAADDLVQVAGPDHYAKVLFSSSGGAANDMAMKVARHFHALAGQSRRDLVVSMRGSFHGLTFGGFALTGEELGQRVYGVDQRLVRHVEPDSVTDLETLFSRGAERIAAVVVEPVQGTGTVPLSEEYVCELLRLRDEHGFLLIADEVATGFGRTGAFFATHRWPGQPDLLITSKGLTNGTCPASAVIASRRVAERFAEHDAVLTHAETQGGSPVPCAAISATIAEMRRLNAVARARSLGERLAAGMDALVAELPQVTEATGMGCFRTLGVVGPDGSPLSGEEVAALVAAVRDAGALVHPGPGGVQLIPALTYGEEELEELLGAVREGVLSHHAALSTRPATGVTA
ncbi:daptide-type RiPP biosynthesis aminotransferase [Nocardiopsis sp. FIRDI 009]|uniref:daptide-type RiPP biosynthesis aminotransferase n=1 Tax=Nocardiopsis sp. FIRDI 009 TaxID=714197 RepID=UPI000E247C6C|nr:daptide-type RiPP biosynthesis aminotransferase [Nocardiopsis sp. FIRDI 009]